MTENVQTPNEVVPQQIACSNLNSIEILQNIYCNQYNKLQQPKGLFYTNSFDGPDSCGIPWMILYHAAEYLRHPISYAESDRKYAGSSVKLLQFPWMKNPGCRPLPKKTESK